MLQAAYFPLLADFLANPPSWALANRFVRWYSERSFGTVLQNPHETNLKLQTTLDFALNSPFVFEPTKSCVHIYGSHHQNFYCWDEVETVLKRLKNPVICLELPEMKYSNYVKRVKKLGVNPEKIQKKATIDDRANFDMVSMVDPKEQQDYFWERGCIHGNEFASAIRMCIRQKPEFIDVGMKQAQVILQKMERNSPSANTSGLDISIYRFLQSFYGIEDPLKFRPDVVLPVLAALHPPTLTQAQLLLEIYPKYGDLMWNINVPRELHMIRRLHNVCCLHPNRTILAIVGVGHLPGFMQFWKRHIPDSLFTRLQNMDADWEHLRQNVLELTDPTTAQNKVELQQMVESPKKYCV